MNVGAMRKLIEGMPDDVKFYTIVGDHKAQEVWFSDWFIVKHLFQDREFFRDEDIIFKEVKVRALVIDG